MKSTGLFGKNSGRVGGVVYANYRGEQIVRTYQPKVTNPSTRGQVMQRAKFKLVSQLSAVFGKELNSYAPSKANETSRNSWVRAMLKKAQYDKNQKEATLAVQDIVLTSDKLNIFDEVTAEPEELSLLLNNEEWDSSEDAKVHIVEVGWDENDQMVITNSHDEPLTNSSVSILTINRQKYKKLNALVFAYKPKTEATRVSYEDYNMDATKATLADMQAMYGSDLEYTRTINISIPAGV